MADREMPKLRGYLGTAVSIAALLLLILLTVPGAARASGSSDMTVSGVAVPVSPSDNKVPAPDVAAATASAAASAAAPAAAVAAATPDAAVSSSGASTASTSGGGSASDGSTISTPSGGGGTTGSGSTTSSPSSGGGATTSSPSSGGGSATSSPSSGGGTTSGGSTPAAPSADSGSSAPAGGTSTDTGSTSTPTTHSGPAQGGSTAQATTPDPPPAPAPAPAASQPKPATINFALLPTPMVAMPTIVIPRIPNVAAEVDPLASHDASVLPRPERQQFGNGLGVQPPILVMPDLSMPDVVGVIATPVPSNRAGNPDLWTPTDSVAAAYRAPADGTSAPARPFARVVPSESAVTPPAADAAIGATELVGSFPSGAEHRAAAPERRSRLHGAGQVNVAVALDGAPLATGYAPPGGVGGASGGGVGAGGAAAALFGLIALWLLRALLPRLLALDLFPLISALCAQRLERPG
jgi:hypothetical protein